MKKVSVKELQAKVEGFMNEHAKKIILGLLIAAVCGVGGCSIEDSEKVKNFEKAERLSDLVKILKDDNKELEDKNKSLEDKNKSLEKKVEIAKDYLDLDDNEKELVDAKIVEVNEATEQKIAEEQARKEQEEAERKAKEEQEEKERKEKEEAEKKAKEEEERARKEAEEQARREAEAQKYNTGLTYEDIARNPAGNAGKLLTFSGKILQVIKANGCTQYRMAVDDNYDQVVLIEIDNKLLSNGNILEDDHITIKGMFIMEYTYTTVLGAEKSIPAIVVDEFSFN